MNITNALLGIRKNTGLTQTEFADKVKITQSYLSQIENGHKEPSMELISEYAKFVDIPVGVIIFMATEESDVAEPKRELFRQLKPVLDSLINQLFKPKE